MHLDKRLATVLILGIVIGATVGIAAKSYIIHIYIRLTEPPATVDTGKIGNVYINAAPYQSFKHSTYFSCAIKQNSDRVNYHFTFNATNMENWKVCVDLIDFAGNKYGEKCAAQDQSTINYVVSKPAYNCLTIWLTVYGKTTGEDAKLDMQITPTAQP